MDEINRISVSDNAPDRRQFNHPSDNPSRNANSDQSKSFPHHKQHDFKQFNTVGWVAFVSEINGYLGQHECSLKVVVQTNGDEFRAVLIDSNTNKELKVLSYEELTLLAQNLPLDHIGFLDKRV